MPEYIDRKNDEEIIGLIREILSHGEFKVETINEAILVKLMSLRGTPIKVDESYRDVDKDLERWKSEKAL